LIFSAVFDIEAQVAEFLSKLLFLMTICSRKDFIVTQFFGLSERGKMIKNSATVYYLPYFPEAA